MVACLKQSYIRKVLSVAIVQLLLIPSIIFAQEQVLLQTKDIHKVMDQIFQQHVDKKEITLKIIRNSFRVYIDQFDPERIYLLEKDVAPFLEMSEAGVQKIDDEYQKNQFQKYVDLNQVIQKSILRVRKIRAELMKDDKAEIFQKSRLIKADGNEDWSDPDLRQGFPKDEAELKDHIKVKIIRFIALERKRYGDAFIDERQTQTLNVFQKQAEDVENQYLFVLLDGKPMSASEKENAFAMHVLKALSNSLDAHTTILNPAEANDMKMRLEKGVIGVGINVEATKNGDFRVTEVLDNSPASKNGQIKVGDILSSLDGSSLKNKSIDEVNGLLKGKIGTNLSLDLIRAQNEGEQADKKVYHVELSRQDIQIDDDRAKYMSFPFQNGIIGVITLDSFYQSDNGISSETDIADAIKKLQQKGNLRGLILDFRENSGGFLSQAIKVAGLFITNGIVVISKYFNGEEHFYRDMDKKVAFDGPLIILTSKATASAAEIVAQALQDYGVAVIVGDETTYGKGTIQSQTVTEDKATALFKVTVGKYYTVSGKTPQIEGVKADVVVPSQFAHENIGERYLENAIDGAESAAGSKDTIASTYEDPLQDISSDLKSWYMHYYTPTLQHRKFIPEDLFSVLRKASKDRISKNQNYQAFLKGTGKTQSYQGISQKNESPADLQLDESVNIMKDLIVYDENHRGVDETKETVSNPKP